MSGTATPTPDTTPSRPPAGFLARRHELHELRVNRVKAEGLSDLTSLPAFIPDALVDSKYERRRRANVMFKHGVGLPCRLLVASDHRLKLVTVPIGSAIAAGLYSPRVNARARAHARAIVGNSPAWCKLELGLDGGLHLHLLVAADAALMLPRGSKCDPVKPTDADLKRVLGYLCKPADARACMTRLSPREYGKPDPVLRAAAILDYQHARAARRLPDLSWTHKVPRLKPDALLLESLA
jgi:hypothetical protein